MRTWHDHKPFEACDTECPKPHMNAVEAEAWWQEYLDAPDEVARKLVEIKAKPRAARARTKYGFIGGY